MFGVFHGQWPVVIVPRSSRITSTTSASGAPCSRARKGPVTPSAKTSSSWCSGHHAGRPVADRAVHCPARPMATSPKTWRASETLRLVESQMKLHRPAVADICERIQQTLTERAAPQLTGVFDVGTDSAAELLLVAGSPRSCGPPGAKCARISLLLLRVPGAATVPPAWWRAAERRHPDSNEMNDSGDCARASSLVTPTWARDFAHHARLPRPGPGRLARGQLGDRVRRPRIASRVAGQPNQCAASYSSITFSGMRPRSFTLIPADLAHLRISALRSATGGAAAALPGPGPSLACVLLVGRQYLPQLGGVLLVQVESRRRGHRRRRRRSPRPCRRPCHQPAELEPSAPWVVSFRFVHFSCPNGTG